MNERYIKEGEARAAIEEVTMQRAIVAFLNQPDAFSLLQSPSAEALQKLFSELSDQPKIISQDEARTVTESTRLESGDYSALDHGTPTRLEGYLLAKASRSLTLESESMSTGSAMQVSESIHCLRDEVRTKRFIAAVQNAVRELEANVGGRELRVCDAGAGALPVMAIAAALTSPQVRCICIEGNPNSARIARGLIAALNLADQIEIVEGDIRSYERPGAPFDVIISETMDAGLLFEPQVENMNYLHATASHAGTLFIPCSIDTLAAIIPLNDVQSTEEFVHIDDHIAPNLKTRWQKTGEYKPGQPFSVAASVVAPTEQVVSRVYLSTRVNLGVNTLEPGDSKITFPVPVTDIGPLDLRNQAPEVRLTYRPGCTVEDVSVGT